MIPLAAAGLGVGLGGLKSIFDEMRANRQRQVAGAEARFSPWTGIRPRQVEEPNLFGNLLQGGLTGYLMGSLGGAGGLETKELGTMGGNIVEPNVYGSLKQFNPLTGERLQMLNA